MLPSRMVAGNAIEIFLGERDKVKKVGARKGLPRGSPTFHRFL